MAITKVIDPIPPAPKRSDPQNFDDRADEFLGRIETLDEDLNEWAEQCNQTQQEIDQIHIEVQNIRSATEEIKNQTDTIKNETELIKNQAQTYRDQAYRWANESEDVLINDGTHTGYSAYHWAQKTSRGDVFNATSATNLTVEVGVKTLVLNEPNRAYTVGSPIRIVTGDDPVNVWMEGIVVSYNGDTLTVDITNANGTGDYSNWYISLLPSNTPNPYNPQLPQMIKLVPLTTTLVIKNSCGMVVPGRFEVIDNGELRVEDDSVFVVV